MNPRGTGRWAWVLAAVVLLAGAGGVGYWWYLVRNTRPEPDMEEVLTLNNKGVGLMEQFARDERKKAVTVFEEVVEKAPDWLPGRINLGIALFNRDQTADTLKRAVAVFEEVLRRDPDNLHATYCIGIIRAFDKKPGEARSYFRKVTEKDPTDACAWYYLGKTYEDEDSERALECYRKALAQDPHHHSAMYGFAMLMREKDLDKAKALLDEWTEFNNRGIKWQLLVSSNYDYGLAGKYAQVIAPTRPTKAPEPKPEVPLFLPEDPFKVELAKGARWCRAADIEKGEVNRLRARVRERFGGTLATLDYDRDGRPDVFVAGAVVEAGEVGDLLLHNEGKGRFVDVTVRAGLHGPHATLGCTVGDFDNDGYPDLFLTGAGSQKLFRNTGKGTFEDVTAKAGLNELGTVCLGSALVDLDQDGDLDLLIAEYARTAADALRLLSDKKGAPGGGLVVYLNTGTAPPHDINTNQPPLTCAWKRAEDLGVLRGPEGAVVGVALSDVEGDRDVDVVVLSEHVVPDVALNDRLLHFRRMALGKELAPPSPWNGALILDADHDGRSDLFLVASAAEPRLLLNHTPVVERAVSDWFKAGEMVSPALKQAHAADIDLDGWGDVVGLSTEGLPVLVRNQEGKLALFPDGLGRAEDWPKDLLAVLPFPSKARESGEEGSTPHCSGVPDLLAWSESKGLLLRSNRGNAHHALQLELAGQIKRHPAGLFSRCNADGVGTWVVAQAGAHWTGQESTTLSAGLGQSRQPLLLGLGKHPRLDVLRLRWPDGVLQAELDLACGRGPALKQDDRRKDTSCPVLFVWDGEKYRFVTDFLGAGTVAEMNPDGSCRPPRPEESVKLEPGQLQPRDGFYSLAVAEPMDEVTYLDRLQLVVVDHPADTHVYPDERFATSGPQPTQEVFAFSERTFPVAARDHRGRDLTRTLREWDRDTADGFARRAWLGFAEEHFVELDFGDRLSRYGKGDRLFLCLAGWTDYAYPRAIYAAEQAGVAMIPPVLERQGADGKWEKVAEVGFPAGLPRMMTFEVTGKLAGPQCKLRLRTNLQVFWDQVFVAGRCRPVGEAGVRMTTLEVARANLRASGIMQEYAPDGKPPTVFAHDRYETVPLNRLAGKLTRHGDVRELLTRGDDCFAIFGPGDELRVDFDARGLPALPAGWQRSFVLRTRGYCKGAGPFTATGTTVEPLPFMAMSAYPYGPKEHYPDDEMHREYRRRYNTRVVVPDLFPRKPAGR
jgi:TPR repeat protein